MAGIFKTYSPKLNPMHVMGMSGDSPAGVRNARVESPHPAAALITSLSFHRSSQKPEGAIGYVAEGGLTGQYSVEKFPLEAELEAKGLTSDKWEAICKSLAAGKGMTG